jgi:uncharacterized protein (TIGR02594 family)
MEQPSWLAAAWAELGVRETAGSQSNDRVVRYFAEAGRDDVRDDSVAWCAAFAGAMLKRGGETGTGSLLARSYLDWGTPLKEPRLGAIAVLTRGSDPGAGHIGFLVGTAGKRLFLLGGNQSDGVTVEGYDASRLLGYRWPAKAAVAADNGVFARALAHVLKMEGGYTNDPYDPGGPTNQGVTLKVFAQWKGEALNAGSRERLIAELKVIPKDTVSAVYRKRYWDLALCEKFSPPIALMHFDAAVNHGVTGAARLLQGAVGTTVDGEIGPKTLAAVSARSALDLLEAYAEARRVRYRTLAHFWRFGRGWLNRVEATLALARSWQADGQAKGGAGSATVKGDNTVASDVDTNNGKWWLQSRTLWGTLITAAATVIPVLGPLIGVSLPGDVIVDAGSQVDSVVQAVAGLVGTLLTIYGRFRAGGPLSLRRPEA